MTRRARIFAAIAVVIVLVVGGCYTAYWFIVAGRIEKIIDRWVDDQRHAGFTVEFERGPVWGFPVDFRATFHRPHIAGEIAGKPFDWRGPDVTLSVSPIDLQGISLSGPGHHTLDLGSGPAQVDATALSARLAYDGSTLQSFLTVKFSGLRVILPDGKTVAAASGEASLTSGPQPKVDSDPLVQFAADAKDLKLPEGTVLLTADPLGEARIAGTVKGPMPLAPLRQALASWRDAGGTVEVTDFAVTQATLSLSGSATVALDANLQPIVAADVRARGLAATIDLLASQRRIYPEDALKMKLFVKGAERDTRDGYKEVATGLTLQGGYLSWGPFKIAQVPPIAWP